MAKTITAEDRELIIKIAKLFIDSPYQFWWSGSLPWEAFDCSRYTQLILENVGITIERSSAMQWEQFSSTWNMISDLSKAEIWDLIFYKDTYQSENEITHVWFYAWNNKMIHAGWKKVEIISIDKYRKDHFKWIWILSWFAKDFDEEKAIKNYNRLSNKDNNEDNTLKAVNAVIAVLTSTWWDLPKKYQELSAEYAKKLRNDYPEARKLEPDQSKKVYQSVVDMLSYAWKFAWNEEQKKYSNLVKHLRQTFWLR